MDQVQSNEIAYYFMSFFPNWMIFFHLSFTWWSDLYIIFFQPLNHVDFHLKLRFLIKSGYHIVPSPSIALMQTLSIYCSQSMTLLHFLKVMPPGEEEDNKRATVYKRLGQWRHEGGPRGAKGSMLPPPSEIQIKYSYLDSIILQVR